MSVRFQYAGDKDISVGRAGGASLFSLPGAISFPPAGSYNSTLYGVEYPVAQGGTSFADPSPGAAPFIANQICDVDVENDGSGGTYTDWTTATNIQYKPNGSVFYITYGVGNNIEVPSGSGQFYVGGSYDDTWFHDGAGSYGQSAINISYFTNGTDTNIESVSGGNQTTEVPTGSGNYYDNGRFNGYTWDGAGSYNYPVAKGNYYASGTDTNLSGLDVAGSYEVPTGSGNYYPSGDVTGYTWDGSGGYNSGVSKGSQYPAGTVIFYTVISTSTSTEVPAGSGSYFDSYVTSGDLYKWDFTFNPPYTYNSAFYYPYGTYITFNAGDYYWDGNGGYYT